MALKKCKECGHEVSSKADKCPNCGNPINPVKKGGMGCGSLILGLIVIVIIISIVSSMNRGTNQSEQKPNPSPAAASLKGSLQGTKKESNPPHSVTRNHTTNQGYLACITEQSLDEAINYAVQKDNAALAQMVGSGECIVLKQGVRVTIEDVKMFSGKVAIRPVGTRLKLWTVNEAVK